ncbi:MAG: four helix bundle protein [Parcubacteria group bacterium]|jgi:four helix bundle protein
MEKQIKNYKDLIVWKKSMELVNKVYTLTKKFPRDELFGLSSQMRRSAISLPSNIAEGHRRGTRKDYAHFITIAFGSGAELETQILIAKNQNYCSNKECESIDILLEEIMKMLNVLQSKLKSTPPPSTPHPPTP